jgi:exopolyphosphatase/guanosine-5'-triphosphate,3'-diphosphate pyrophosphatase
MRELELSRKDIPVPAIVPRWELRAFGPHFGAAADRLAALAPARLSEGDELYLLSVGGDDNVKIRDGVLERKQLLQVNEEGLEQWLPVLKAEFPVSAAEVGTVLEALAVSPPPLARTAYTLPELLGEVVRPSEQLRAVPVHKRRERYSLDGWLAERTDVRSARASTCTMAVESEDPARVIAAVRELGLESFSNVSFPQALKAFVGYAAARFAVIDVGTNSVKFLVGERSEDGSWRTVADRAEVTRLGEGLGETGELSEPAMQRTLEAVAGIVEEASRESVLSLAAVGTAGLRRASNSTDFIDAVRRRCGIEIEVIPGEEEARLAYLAVMADLGLTQGSLVVFDTGGGSSQFTFGRDGGVEEQFSVDVGAARYTERFGLDRAVSEDELRAALEAIAADLARLDGRPTPDALVGLGGAVTNLAAVKHGLATYDPDVVRGTVLDDTEIDRQIELYRTRNVDERRAIVGLQPGRAEIILAGACIVRTVLTKLGRRSFVVSDRGLRHGLLMARFG